MPWLSLWGELSPQVTERTLRPRDVICLRRCQHFPIGRCRYLPSPSSLRSATSPTGEARGCRDGNRFTTIRLSGGTRIEGSRKTVNGARIDTDTLHFCANIRCLGSPFGRAVTQVTEREPCARGTSSACEGASIFRLDVAVICPLRPRCARPPLPQGEAKCRDGNRLHDHPTFGRHAH